MSERHLCWTAPTGFTHRAVMTAAVADRLARFMAAIFPHWPVWTEPAREGNHMTATIDPATTTWDTKSIPSVEDRIVAVAVKALAQAVKWDDACDELRAAIFNDPDFAKVAFAKYEDAVLRRYMAIAANATHEARGGRPKRDDTQPKPGPTLRASRAVASEAARKSLLDTMWIDGARLGDVSAETARTWGGHRAREARFITILTQGIAPADARPLRAVVTAEDAAEAMKRANAS
jgi:hypothetical protein